MMPTMKVQYLLKQWNDSGYELVITRNAYWQTRYIEPETTENSVSFMEYDYPVQSLGDQALQNNQLKRKGRNTRITRLRMIILSNHSNLHNGAFNIITDETLDSKCFLRSSRHIHIHSGGLTAAMPAAFRPFPRPLW